MVLIIKKLVPVFKPTDRVPKKYLNLKKPVHVTTFKNPYPNMTDILIKEYGLKPDDKILVFWTKEISLPHFNRYRLPFRKAYSGPVRDFRRDGLVLDTDVASGHRRTSKTTSKRK